MLRRPVADGSSHAGAWTTFADELERSRRYGHSFALLRIARNGFDRRPWDAPERLRSLTGCLRGVDQVWLHREDVLVLLPELGGDQAEAAVRRLERAAPEALEGAVVVRAVFPEDGLTAGALLRRLEVTAGDVAGTRGLDVAQLRDAARRLRERESRRRLATEPVPLPDGLGERHREAGQAGA